MISIPTLKPCGEAICRPLNIIFRTCLSTGLIYNVMYDFLTENNLLSPNQSGFRSAYSCINQLLSVNYEILNAFGKGVEARGIFLDISKAFDKIWHDGLIFKLRQNSISGDVIML